MSVVTPYLKKLDKIKDSMERVARRAVQENMEFILFQIKERQLGLGMNSQGGIVGVYKPFTKKLAADPTNKPREPKIVGQPYNFEWSGELFDTLTLKLEADSYSIFSTTGKDKFLEEQFKTKLTKLTPENNEIINNTIILPHLYKYILENFLKV